MNLLPKILPLSKDEKEARLERELIRREAEIGGQLFGPLPKGHQRQFFCLDEHTWIWHEAWKADGRQHAVTTRYDIRPSGVIKSQAGQANQSLSKAEARHLLRAAELYQQRVEAYYRQLQTA